MFKSDTDFDLPSSASPTSLPINSYNREEAKELINSQSIKSIEEISSRSDQYDTYQSEEVVLLINAQSSKVEPEIVKKISILLITWKEYEVFALMEGTFDARNFPKEHNQKKEKSAFDSMRLSGQKEAKKQKSEKSKKISSSDVFSYA